MFDHCSPHWLLNARSLADDSQDSIAANSKTNNASNSNPKTSAKQISKSQLIGKSDLNLIINYVNSWTQRYVLNEPMIWTNISINKALHLLFQRPAKLQSFQSLGSVHNTNNS